MEKAREMEIVGGAWSELVWYIGGESRSLTRKGDDDQTARLMDGVGWKALPRFQVRWHTTYDVRRWSKTFPLSLMFELGNFHAIDTSVSSA